MGRTSVSLGEVKLLMLLTTRSGLGHAVIKRLSDLRGFAVTVRVRHRCQGLSLMKSGTRFQAKVYRRCELRRHMRRRCHRERGMKGTFSVRA